MRHRLPWSVLALVLGGCVSSGQYHKREAELQDQAANREAELKAQAATQAAEAAQREAALGADLKAVTAERDKLKTELDNTTALVTELKQRLEKLGQNVDKLTGERGSSPRGSRTPSRGWTRCESRSSPPRSRPRPFASCSPSCVR